MMVQCANESVPQGGKKDEIPPKARKMNPPDKTVLFQSSKIEITFDEFVQNTGFPHTLVSPPMDKNPDYKIHGKTLAVKLKSALRPNTTYTINFADDIKDVNEGNMAPNFTYVFSTGSYIDSQKISGKVILAKEGNPAEGVLVLLYPAELPDAVLTDKPYYFSKTDKSGAYQIRNVKWGDYNIYALKDQNFNYRYDQPNELIGFIDSVLHLTDTLHPQIELQAFEAEKNKALLDRAKSIAPGHLQISYTTPVKTFQLISEWNQENDFWYFNETKDTIHYWFQQYDERESNLFFIANDTLKDTARIEMKFVERDSMLHAAQNAVTLTNSEFGGSGFNKNRDENAVQELYKPLKLFLSRPVSEINALKTIQIMNDSTNKIYTPEFSLDERTKMFLTADFDKEENTSYSIVIPDSILRDMFGTWNHEIIYRFRTNNKNDYGTINLTLKATGTEAPYIFRLLNGNNDVVKEIPFTGDGEQKVKLEKIPAGRYNAEIIEDRNANGKWDTGDFKNKIQPEKVYTFKDTYQLKGGWDLEVEVKF